MTGGDSGPALAGLAKMFRDPMAYGVLPYKNFYTRDNRVQYTGFFIPAHEFSLRPEYLDERGVTDSIRFKAFYEEKRAGMHGTDALTYAAENCFTPDEALLKQGDNIFDSELISQQLTYMATSANGECPKPIPMGLAWDRTTEKEYNKVNAYPLKNSKLLVLEPPQTFSDGSVYKNLYVAGIDAIDQGKDNSAMDTDVSEFCIVIKRRVFGMRESQYVAIYKDRPRDIQVAYDMAFKLLVWYNARAVLEFTKIGFQKFLENKKRSDLLMERPEFAVSAKNRRKATKRLIGIPATEAVITHGLELIQIQLTEGWQDIYFEEMLYQLLNYSYEDKRKFDIIAALICTEIGDEQLMDIRPAKTNEIKSNWQDIGWYRDEKGYLRYGVIPNKNLI